MSQWFPFRHDRGRELLARHVLLIIPVLVTLGILDERMGARLGEDGPGRNRSRARSISQEVGLAIEKALTTAEDLAN